MTTLGWFVIIALLLCASVVILWILIRKIRRQAMMLRVQSSELERQVRELRFQNQQQEELNKEKKQLVLLVSHDLKGPFNRIFALIQLLELGQTNLVEEQKDYINKMYQIVGDGLNMVRNLVDVRKIEEKGLEPYKEEFDLIQVVKPIVKQYGMLAGRKRIEVNSELPDQLHVNTDKNYLSRVIENLLSNAIKFSPSGSRVVVRIVSKNDRVELAVIDNGPGLTKEDMVQLYQRYKKLTPRPTGGESSTGLGLSIAKQQVQCLGGQITCHSQPGEGTTFSFEIPVDLPTAVKES